MCQVLPRHLIFQFLSMLFWFWITRHTSLKSKPLRAIPNINKRRLQLKQRQETTRHSKNNPVYQLLFQLFFRSVWVVCWFNEVHLSVFKDEVWDKPPLGRVYTPKRYTRVMRVVGRPQTAVCGALENPEILLRTMKELIEMSHLFDHLTYPNRFLRAYLYQFHIHVHDCGWVCPFFLC